MTIEEEYLAAQQALDVAFETIRLAKARVQALFSEKCYRDGCGVTFGEHEGSVCRHTGCTGFVRVVLVPCPCCEASAPCETGPSGGRCCVCCMDTGTVQG